MDWVLGYLRLLTRHANTQACTCDWHRTALVKHIHFKVFPGLNCVGSMAWRSCPHPLRSSLHKNAANSFWLFNCSSKGAGSMLGTPGRLSTNQSRRSVIKQVTLFHRRKLMSWLERSWREVVLFGNSELSGKNGRRVQNKFPEVEAVELRKWQHLHKTAKNGSAS